MSQKVVISIEEDALLH